MGRPRNRISHQRQLVTDWRYPKGTRVVVLLDGGDELRTTTTSEPWLLGGHTACIMLDGIRGAYSLGRVRLDDDSRGATP